MKAARGLLKVVALVIGGVVTFVSLMSLAGSWVSNGWVRGGIALAIALIVPLVLVEVVLARRAPNAIKGVTTDVLALCYMAFALAYVGAAHAETRPLLQHEAQRLESAGMPRLARVAYLLAGDSSSETARAVTVASPDSPRTPTDDKRPAEKPGFRTGDGKDRTPAQIFTEFAPSVVTITVKMEHGEGGGTGFVLDSNGTIGTNFHVIDKATTIEVKLMDGTVADHVEILVENEPNDLALLRIKSKQSVAPVVLGDSDKVTVGERAVSIGNPLGLEHTLTDGVVSSRRMLEGRKLIQMSTPVSPGNSGGPLFNAKGEVIGISTAIFLGNSALAQNLNLAVPINDLKAMIRTDYPGRRKAGEQSMKGGRW